MKTKKDAAYSYEHTKERALERLEIALTPKIYEEWNRLAAAAPILATERDGNRIQTVRDFTWRARVITCVYETPKNCITTVLSKRNA